MFNIFLKFCIDNSPSIALIVSISHKNLPFSNLKDSACLKLTIYILPA